MPKSDYIPELDPNDYHEKTIITLHCSKLEKHCIKVTAQQLGMSMTQYLLHFAIPGAAFGRCANCAYLTIDLECPGCSGFADTH